MPCAKSAIFEFDLEQSTYKQISEEQQRESNVLKATGLEVSNTRTIFNLEDVFNSRDLIPENPLDQVPRKKVNLAYTEP